MEQTPTSVSLRAQRHPLAQLPPLLSSWYRATLFAAVFALAGTTNAQLTGTKNVPGDYGTLAAALSALNTQGVGTGGVTINLVAGNPQTATAGGYVIGGAGSLVLTTASSGNPITIVGNGNTITAPTPQTSGNLNDAIFKLIGADWTTISGFTMRENVSNANTTAASNNMTEWGVALLYVTTTDGARNNTIQNNTIDLDRSYQNTFGIYSNSTHSATNMTTSATATGANGGNDNLRIYGNTITDVNQGIVHVGPTAAADHNNTADIGGTTALQGNTISQFGRTGTFSGYVNVSGSVNGILVRNTRNFNISWNSITSQNSGPLLGTLNGIQIPSSSEAVIGTLTQTINNNSLSLQKGSTSGINGITMTGFPANSVNSTTTCNMNGNNFHTFGHTVSTSSDIYFMNQSGNPLVQTFNNNTFSNISVNTTGEVLFFRYVNNMVAGASLSISNNAIVGGFTRTGVGTTTVWGVSGTSSVNGTTHTITGNNFSNINLTGASEFTGFRDWDGNASGGPTKTITGNTFSNITTGAQLVTPLSVDFAAPSSTVGNNTITNITSALTTGVGAMLYLGTGNKTGLVCSGNTIADISVAAPFLYGIQNAASNVTISKNRIHGLSTSSTTASGWVTAIQVQTSAASSTVTVANNLVGNLTAPASTNPNGIIGINMSGNAGSSSFRVYYNSIFLNASTSGAGFGSSGIQAAGSSTATTSALDMRNNIVVNTSVQNGAGRTVAYRRTTGTSGTLANYTATSNNNLFYAGTPSATNLIYADGTSTAQSLIDYKSGVFTAGTIGARDAASVTENPPFLSTVGSSSNFLHIDPSVATLTESGGTPVASITDDFDGNTRNVSTPDIGADEFNGLAGCTTPPDAGTDGTLNACTNSTTNSLFAQLGGTPDTGGSWSGPSTVIGGNYDATTMDPGVYTYTVDAVAPCIGNDQSTATVTESNPTNWYADTDGDGFGSGPSTGSSCTPPNVGDVSNNTDNCPALANPGQADSDSDGLGDVCDVITLLSSFDPSNASGLCGLAYDADSARIWAYDCSAATVQQYTTAGTFVRSIVRPGESTNDVDISMVSEPAQLGSSTIPYGRLLFINGETGTADIYGVEQGPGTVIASLATAFGLNHVVGGAYHPTRNTYFLVQDDDAAAADANRVAEIDPVTGAVLNTFQFTGTYAVNFGDLEISAANGNLFLVSNTQTNIAEFTPTGTFVRLHPLPVGVSALSGLSLDCATGTAWACSSSGIIHHLGNFPCVVNDVCAGGPEPGTACDDNNTATTGDVIQANCTCAGTPGTENTAIACADGVDNDGDGFSDCDDPGCQALNANIGCTTCFGDGLSFADAVVNYSNNCGANIAIDPSQALGMPDWAGNQGQNHVSLGNGGYVSLLFTNNTLTNSGTSSPDLFVFEVGQLVEASTIELRPLNAATTTALINAGRVDADSDGFYEFGGIGGALASVDIDAFVPGAPGGTLLFDAVQVVDNPDGCSGTTPGADIDAVCALSSVACSVGASCDDGNACTTGDVLDANCNCAGAFADADADGTCDANDLCPGGPEPGTACNDNDACTTGDVIGTNCLCAGTFADADADGTCDANDLCPGGPEPGTACNDNDACTTGDVIGTNCLCAGTFADVDADGTCDANDLCPSGPEPGSTCDDNNTVTINDIIQADCSCAGTLLNTDCLGVPGGSALPGTSCNDGLATTGNDVYGANCVCAGQLIDCLGVAGGTALPGTSCNDGLATTGNDVYGANCVCAGQLIDCLGVAGGSALPGTSCNDNNANTGNDVYGANCVCAGQVIDCLGVIGGTALPGTACNDNNASTINDVYGANCVCAGTPIAGCDNWTLEFTTDNAGSESTWQIINSTTLSVIGAGGPYASNTTTTATICIPAGACYRLTVTDANGMSNGTTGGFVLRDQNGKRVLDNAGDGVFTGISQAVAPFCSPVGNDGLIASQCDKVDWIPGGLLIASPNSAVSAQYGVGTQNNDGYEFRIFNPDGGYDRTVFITHANPVPGAPAGATAACYLGFSSLITNPVPQNVLLNVRVRSAVNGVFSAWGPACRFKIDAAAAACPLTKLITTPGSTFSCGATGKVVNASGAAGRIYAQPVTRPVGGVNQAANAYLFELTNTANGYTRLIGASSYTLVLGKWATAPLLCGTHTYNVRVRASFDGGATYCPYGAVCTVGITNNFAAPFCTAPAAPAMAAGDDRVFFDGDETSTTSVLNLWPNPNNGGQLYVTIDGLQNEVTTATVDIFDMVGHKVATRTIAVNGTTLNTVIALDASWAKGLYLVAVTVGDEQLTGRLMLQ